MNALGFAWRSLVRQPARAVLGILGVAAVGALLFDMLLLSDGLVISMRELLDRAGFEIRVTTNSDIQGPEPAMEDGASAAATIAKLPTVRSAVSIRTENADLQQGGGMPARTAMIGIAGQPHLWTVLQGRDTRDPRDVVLNAATVEQTGLTVGDTATARAFCESDDAAPPPIELHVVGIAEFPFQSPDEAAAGLSIADLAAACADSPERVEMIAVTSTGDQAAAVKDISAARPDLRAVTNDEALGQMQQRGFTYFRQISVVLTTITVAFALLLITVLLTVSVNQRLAAVAALRALGLSQRRVVLDVLCESALIVGIGGAVSLPLGWALAIWLDRILKRMPNLPADLHFFVFQPSALATHASLMVVTALLAAAYPMFIVARLPIATTLRNEVVS